MLRTITQKTDWVDLESPEGRMLAASEVAGAIPAPVTPTAPIDREKRRRLRKLQARARKRNR